MQQDSGIYKYQQNTFTRRGEAKALARPKDMKLNPAFLRQISKTTPWKTFAALAFDWAVVFLTVYVQSHLLSLWFLPVTFFVIASRQQALGVVVHEAAHFLFLKNKILNDVISDWTMAFPLNLTTYGFRREHLTHHRLSGLPGDPDTIRLAAPHYQTSRTTKGMVSKLLVMCTGIYIIRELQEMAWKYQLSRNVPWQVNLSRVLFYSLAAAIITLTGSWTTVALYWYGPMVTVLMPVIFIRLKAEHDAVPKNKMINTRNVETNFIEKFFLAQHNINLHLDHHLFPSVPFYNLEKLHSELKKNEAYMRDAQNTRGYLTGLWKELTKPLESEAPVAEAQAAPIVERTPELQVHVS